MYTVAAQRSHAVSETGLSAAIACHEAAFVFHFEVAMGSVVAYKLLIVSQQLMAACPVRHWGYNQDE
jgi:hypothetical protein